MILRDLAAAMLEAALPMLVPDQPRHHEQVDDGSRTPA
jgi:hypothetical protein